MQLRDYLYLDSKRLEDYMSLFDPGELRELHMTIREDNVGIPMPEFAQPTDSGSGRREETIERTLSVSAKHSFNQLYDKLAGTIKDVDQGAETNTTRKGIAVEATRQFEPSPVAQMIQALLDLIRMIQAFGASQLKDIETKRAIDLLSNLFPEDRERERDIPVVSNLSGAGYSIAFLAERQYLLANPDELSGELTLVGKVRRVIPQGQDLDLLVFSNVLPRSITSNAGAGAEMYEAMVQLFTNWPEELGPALDRNALAVKGPVMIIDPLAVFR